MYLYRGDEYKGHTKCISEEEKYGGDGFKAPPNRNKGEKKQQAWVEIVQATMESAGKFLQPAARNLLQALTKHENVPRKKPKFLVSRDEINTYVIMTGNISNVSVI